MDWRRERDIWREGDFLSARDRAEMARMTDEQAADAFYRELEFGTAGMRGLMGPGTNRMNPYVVARATRALAELILEIGEGERGVAIAFDTRNNSAAFAKRAALTLAERGVRAYLFEGPRPVPELSFTLRRIGAIAGIVITASHNPKMYNGYKVYWRDGGQLPPERADELARRIAAIPYGEAAEPNENAARAKGLLIDLGEEADAAYIDYVKGLAINPRLDGERGAELKLVYTPLHGSGNMPVRRALRELGFTNAAVVPEQEAPDGDFPTVAVPNPEEKDALKMALALQEKLGADVAFGTDPDCDRVGLAVRDSSGEARALSGNETGCLLLEYILSQRAALGTLPKNAACVKSIVSTELARAICEAHGCEMVDVLTGFKFIAEKIEQFDLTGEREFVFGFEESCGYLSGCGARDKDGVNASILIAEAALYYKTRGMTLNDALEDIYRRYGYYGAKVKSVALTGMDGDSRMASVMRSLRENPPRRIGARAVTATRDYLASTRVDIRGTSALTLPRADVLYWEIEGGAWVCARPSGTEPKLKLYVNDAADTREALNESLSALFDAAVALIERLIEESAG